MRINGFKKPSGNHPVRTLRMDQETYQIKRGQYIWLDCRFFESPAFRGLPSAAQREIVIAFIGKWGRQTLDGKHRKAVTFGPKDIKCLGYSENTLRLAMRNAQGAGILLCVERGGGANTAKYVLTDQWKQTLNDSLNRPTPSTDDASSTDEDDTYKPLRGR